mgnify:CR=1 FL=1|tara:strand:- start:103 stop:552 length:450 start_codon:yes stop_codon:yes gene_type:complete
MGSKNLKLNATSKEDLSVISAHLQDSITQVKNIVHLKRNRIFLIQFNRFMWEDIEKGLFRKSRRVQSVLKFENVLRAYSKNLNQKNKDRFLDFLAIETNLLSDKSYEIKLNFAGDILIKINSEVIDCFIEDLGEPWETKSKPKHSFFND